MYCGYAFATVTKYKGAAVEKNAFSDKPWIIDLQKNLDTPNH